MTAVATPPAKSDNPTDCKTFGYQYLAYYALDGSIIILWFITPLKFIKSNVSKYCCKKTILIIEHVSTFNDEILI